MWLGREELLPVTIVGAGAPHKLPAYSFSIVLNTGSFPSEHGHLTKPRTMPLKVARREPSRALAQLCWELPAAEW